MWLTLGMVPLVGLVGGAVGGTDAFGWTVLARVGDRPRPWRVWAVMTLVSALVMGLGFVILSLVGLGDLRPLNTMASGFLIGLALTGAATAPLKRSRLIRLVATVLLSMAAFAAVGPLRQVRFEPGDTIRETLSDPIGATKELEAKVEPFLQAHGSPAADGSIRPVKRRSGDGTSMWLEGHNAALSFEFNPPLKGLYTCIQEVVGQPTSVWVNGQPPGTGGAGGNPVSRGSCSTGIKIDVTGPIETFAIGGQDWRMDMLCPTFAEPVHACMEFEGLQARRALLSDQFETWQMLLVGALCGLGFFLGLNRKAQVWTIPASR